MQRVERTTLSQTQYSFECSLAKMTLANLVRSDPGKDALSFFDLNCADNRNNKSGEPRKWQRK
jgi:hypothetical protein